MAPFQLLDPLLSTAYKRNMYNCFTRHTNFLVVPTTTPSETSRKTFDDLVNSLPGGCVDVPMMICCMVEQVASEENDPPSGW